MTSLSLREVPGTLRPKMLLKWTKHPKIRPKQAENKAKVYENFEIEASECGILTQTICKQAINTPTDYEVTNRPTPNLI